MMYRLESTTEKNLVKFLASFSDYDVVAVWRKTQYGAVSVLLKKKE